MSQVMKAFTGVFMVLFLMTTSTGVLGAFYQIVQAQNIHALMIDEAENSDYARPVLDACFQTAKEAGYELEMHLYSDTADSYICKEASQLPADTQEISMMELVLSFSVEIPFFDMKEEKQLYGYAR